MKSRLLGCIAAAAVLFALTALTPNTYAANDLDDQSTPKLLEFVQARPDTGVNTAPIGQYKELADFTISRLKREYPDAKFAAVVNQVVNDKQTKEVRLLIISEPVSDLAVAFKSNCSVNSQFNVTSLPQVAENAQQGNEYKDHWLGDVCARWTLLNHGWTNPDAAIPKTRTARRMFSNVLDISYDKNEVQAYEAAISTLAKPGGQKLVSR